jgi:hypothetical protein
MVTPTKVDATPLPGAIAPVQSSRPAHLVLKLGVDVSHLFQREDDFALDWRSCEFSREAKAFERQRPVARKVDDAHSLYGLSHSNSLPRLS